MLKHDSLFFHITPFDPPDVTANVICSYWCLPCSRSFSWAKALRTKHGFVPRALRAQARKALVPGLRVILSALCGCETLTRAVQELIVYRYGHGQKCVFLKLVRV